MCVARDLSPDVMLLGVQLPDITGFEVVPLVQAVPDPPAIVLISSRDASDYGRRIKRSGARGFIAKAEFSARHAGGRARRDRAMTRRRWGLAALGIALAFWSQGGESVSIHARIPENHFIDAERCPFVAIHLCGRAR